VELTDGSFDKEVLASDDVWIVAFTAPWCGHCKNLMPEWARASAQLKGKAKIGNVDATVNQGLAGKYGVKSYPTIKVFLGGKKSGDAVDYDGGRTASDIVAYAEEEYLKTLPPPEVLQAYDAAGMANCTGKQICFMGYLPLLQDSGKEGREAFVKTLQEVADAYKRRPFGWVWIEGTTQPDLESFFRVADLPALVAINAKKARYALMRGQFSVKGVTAFVGKLNVGRGTTAMDGDLPAFVDGSKWDGEEFVMEEFEEEFDLSDLDDIDLDDEDVAKDEL
jgi:protein disulfide-isomerase A6